MNPALAHEVTRWVQLQFISEQDL